MLQTLGGFIYRLVMKRWVFLVSLLAGSATGIHLKGEFGHGIRIAQGVLWVLLPLAVISLMIVVVEFFERKRMPSMSKRWALTTLWVGLFLACSWVVGDVTCEYHIWRAEQFGEQLLTKIEKYEGENGRLPESLSQVEERTLPYLMDEGCYHPSDVEFLVSYRNPRDLKGNSIMLSRSREWVSFYDRKDWYADADPPAEE